MGQIKLKKSNRLSNFTRIFLFSLLLIQFSSADAFASGALKPEIDEEEIIDYNPGTGENISDDNSSEEPKPTPPTEKEPDHPDHKEETDLSSLDQPWKRPNTTIVIDAYEGNPIDWNKMAADSKVVGVIHRSSIGTRKDTKYEERKKIAKERGYLWGAYHLGYKGNVKAQADLFLSIIGKEEDTLMILDLEDTGNGTFMTIDEAVQFMEYVYEKTGKIPTVYANHTTTKALNTKVKDHPLMQQSKFWYARFKSTVTDFPVGIWSNYFLWQFSSEINCTKTGSCLYNVPGTLFDMDVNVFNGSYADLVLKWNNQ